MSKLIIIILQKDLMTNSQSENFIDECVFKKQLEQLYTETMYPKNEMSSNYSVYYDHVNRCLYIEYIGYSGTDFHNGQYFMKLEFLPSYLRSPPKISVLTKNGKFAPNTCLSLSISSYHPESWVPKITLTALIINISSAFAEYDMHGVGHISYHTDKEKYINNIKELAKNSHQYNEQHNQKLVEIFNNARHLKASGSEDDIARYIMNQLTNPIQSTEHSN